MRDAVGRVQSVLIVGGSSDIGAATAEQFVAAGTTRVILAGREAARMQQVARRLAPAKVELATLDAVETDTHAETLGNLFRDGDIDVVLVAIGALHDQSAMRDDPRQAVDLASVNYLGALSVSLISANLLAEQGHGSLVLLSSVAAMRPRLSNYIYGSSKAGIDTLAQGMGYELTARGVHVTIVRPGFVKTKMTDGLEVPPFAVTAEQVAGAIVRGVEARASVVWVPRVMSLISFVLRYIPTRIMSKLSF